MGSLQRYIEISKLLHEKQKLWTMPITLEVHRRSLRSLNAESYQSDQDSSEFFFRFPAFCCVHSQDEPILSIFLKGPYTRVLSGSYSVGS